MRIQKLLSAYIIIGSLMGIFFSIGYEQYANRIFSVLLFCLSLWAGFMTFKMQFQKALRIYFIIFISELISFKVGNIDFSYGVGLNFVHYFDIRSLRADSSILSLSHSSFISKGIIPNGFIGVNFISLIIIIYLLYIHKKKATLYS